MKYQDILEKALTCNTHIEFCDFGSEVEYVSRFGIKKIHPSSCKYIDSCEGFGASFSSLNDSEGLISLRGDFGNIRIKFNNGIVKIYKREWNEDHSEFKDILIRS